MFWDVWCLKCTSLSDDYPFLGMTIKHIVRCTQDSVYMTALMIKWLWNTHMTNAASWSLPLVPVIVQLVVMHRHLKVPGGTFPLLHQPTDDPFKGLKAAAAAAACRRLLSGLWPQQPIFQPVLPLCGKLCMPTNQTAAPPAPAAYKRCSVGSMQHSIEHRQASSMEPSKQTAYQQPQPFVSPASTDVQLSSSSHWACCGGLIHYYNLLQLKADQAVRVQHMRLAVHQQMHNRPCTCYWSLIKYTLSGSQYLFQQTHTNKRQCFLQVNMWYSYMFQPTVAISREEVNNKEKSSFG